MADRIIKRHDTAVQPRAKLLDEDGTPLDLTGVTVHYTLRARLTKQVKVLRGTAYVRDQVRYPGEVYYLFAAGDVDTAGLYDEEWEVDWGSGNKETFPLGTRQRVRIEEDYDNV